MEKISNLSGTKTGRKFKCIESKSTYYTEGKTYEEYSFKGILDHALSLMDDEGDINPVSLRHSKFEEVTNEKEIIGYNFKDEKYIKPFNELFPSYVKDLHNCSGVDLNPNTQIYRRVKEEGVVDLWFTPVYKEEKTIESGKWYRVDWINDYDTDILYITEIRNGRAYFTEDAYFRNGEPLELSVDSNEIEFYLKDKRIEFGLATDEEVQEVLTKDAKRRGFVEGAEFNNQKFYDHKVGNKKITGPIKLIENRLDITAEGDYTGQHTIFQNGQWAKIIEEDFKVGDLVVGWHRTNEDSLHVRIWEIGEISDNRYVHPKHKPYWNTLKSNLRKATAEEIEEYKNPKLPEIAGYKGEETESGKAIKYGCCAFLKTSIINMHQLGVKSFVIEADGNDISVSEKQASELFEYLINDKK